MTTTYNRIIESESDGGGGGLIEEKKMAGWNASYVPKISSSSCSSTSLSNNNTLAGLSSYPTPTEYFSDESMSNRSSLGNVFELPTLQINTSIWSESIKTDSSLDSLSTLIYQNFNNSSSSNNNGGSGGNGGSNVVGNASTSSNNNSLDYSSPLSKTDSSISSNPMTYLNSMYNTGSDFVLDSFDNNYDFDNDEVDEEDSLFMPLPINGSSSMAPKKQVMSNPLLSPTNSDGSFRNQLSLINSKFSQNTNSNSFSSNWSSPIVDHLNQRRCISRNSNNEASAASSSNIPQSNLKPNKNLFKTELCSKFKLTGNCPYNSKCQFAHGLNELNFSQKPRNWKTKSCRSWEKYGSCSYGKRCCYKHGDNDDGSNIYF